MRNLLFFSVFLFGCKTPAPGEKVVVTVPIPNRTGFVNDFEGTFQDGERAFLEAWLKMGSDTDRLEVVVVTVDSTHVPDKNLEYFTKALGNKWKVGESTDNLGMVVCISSSLRGIQIQNTPQLTARLNSSVAQKAVDSIFVPLLMEKQFLTACMTGISHLKSVAKAN